MLHCLRRYVALAATRSRARIRRWWSRGRGLVHHHRRVQHSGVIHSVIVHLVRGGRDKVRRAEDRYMISYLPVHCVAVSRGVCMVGWESAVPTSRSIRVAPHDPDNGDDHHQNCEAYQYPDQGTRKAARVWEGRHDGG